MAARNRPGLSEATRQRIKTTMLVERLQKHIVGEVDISQTQMRAIEILLKKTLPDLSSIDLSGPGDDGEITLSMLVSYAKPSSNPT